MTLIRQTFLFLASISWTILKLSNHGDMISPRQVATYSSPSGIGFLQDTLVRAVEVTTSSIEKFMALLTRLEDQRPL